MKTLKVPPIQNPVLHFGSDVAQDLIKREVLGHFAKAFKHKDQWRQEIHLGMLKSMKDERQTKELKTWLLAQCRQNTADVPGLLRRYVLINDNEWRKIDFLEGKKDFWEASKVLQTTRPRIHYYKELVHRMAVCCEKRSIDNQTFYHDFEEERDKIKRASDDC